MRPCHMKTQSRAVNTNITVHEAPCMHYIYQGGKEGEALKETGLLCSSQRRLSAPISPQSGDMLSPSSRSVEEAEAAVQCSICICSEARGWLLTLKEERRRKGRGRPDSRTEAERPWVGESRRRVYTTAEAASGSQASLFLLDPPPSSD